MEEDRNNVLIIGMGPCGLSAAYELRNTNKRLLCIEKNSCVGGLARTLQFQDFRTDIGPHRFFSNKEYPNAFVKSLLKDEVLAVDRLTRFYIKGRYLAYPVELKNILQNMHPLKVLEFIMSYLNAKISRLHLRNGCFNSFEEKIIYKFGKSLARLHILNYTEKIWGMPPYEISPDWVDQRISGLSMAVFIKNAFTGSKFCPKSLVNKFYYPKWGSGLLYETIKNEISKNDRFELKTNSAPLKIIHDNNRISKVIIGNNNESTAYFPHKVVSSIPITEFLNLLEPRAPDEILLCAKNLRFRSHVSLFITLNKNSIFRDQWIYFPDKEIPFCRIMEPKNFSGAMSPEGKTSLFIEFFCWEGDGICNLDKDGLLKLSMPWLETAGFIRRNDIIDYHIHKETHAYPVYTIDYKQHLEKVKGYLNKFKNLQLIGRAGSFRYNNQDHAIEMGRLAAKGIIEGRSCAEEIDRMDLEGEFLEKRGYGS